MTTRYYQSIHPNTNPNGNGSPALLTVELTDTTARLTVKINHGNGIVYAGYELITVSDVTLPLDQYLAHESILLADTIPL